MPNRRECICIEQQLQTIFLFSHNQTIQKMLPMGNYFCLIYCNMYTRLHFPLTKFACILNMNNVASFYKDVYLIGLFFISDNLYIMWYIYISIAI